MHQPGSSFFQTPSTNKVAGPLGGQGQQQNNIFGSPQVNPPKVFSAEYVSKLELRHQKEREQDQAKIANLERYIEQIHGEFSKNKELMQMLVAKCETEKNLAKERRNRGRQGNRGRLKREAMNTAMNSSRAKKS